MKAVLAKDMEGQQNAFGVTEETEETSVRKNGNLNEI
jgi:hypothetical protein